VELPFLLTFVSLMDQSLYQQGIANAEAGDFAAAIRIFDQVLQTNPNWGEVYYQRGLAYFKLNQFAAAIADYTRSSMSNSGNASLYYARGLAHLHLGQLEQAVADAKDAIRLKADFGAAYRLLGTVRQKQNLVEKAVMSYKKAAELYLDQQDVANCRRCLELVRQLQPAPLPTQPTVPPLPPPLSPDEFLQQAVEKAKLKNYRGAIEDLDWAIQIDAQDPRIYVCRAEIKVNADHWDSAIEDYRQAARLYLDRGDKEKTQQILNRIDQLKVIPLQTKPVNPRPARSPSRSTLSRAPVGRVSPAVQRKLLRLVGDDRKIAAGLVERLRQRHPGMPEDWYWEKAIYDLERDRR
jgi:tetratricopeptide (TPR) repeat protein